MSQPDLMLEQQRNTNRLLKLLIRAVLTATPNPMMRKPNLRIVRETDLASSVIQPGATLNVLTLPEKPDTDVDASFLAAQSNIDSASVRHILTSSGKVGKNRPFNFNATQAELGAAGFTSPNNFPLWTPLAAGVLGVFTVVTSALTNIIGLHGKVTVDLKNEGSTKATIQSNGLFIALYEYDQATKDIFRQVLYDTDPSEATTDSMLKLEDVPS